MDQLNQSAYDDDTSELCAKYDANCAVVAVFTEESAGFSIALSEETDVEEVISILEEAIEHLRGNTGEVPN